MRYAIAMFVSAVALTVATATFAQDDGQVFRDERSGSKSTLVVRADGRSYSWDQTSTSLVDLLHRANRGRFDVVARRAAGEALATVDPLRFYEEMRKLGAHELVLDLLPPTTPIPGGTDSEAWLAAVVITESWDRVEALDVARSTPSRHLAHALCLAGRTAAAQQMYRELLAEDDRTVEMAFACGLMPTSLPERRDFAFQRIASARSKETRKAYLSAAPGRKLRAELAVSLYVDGEISAKEMLAAKPSAGSCHATFGGERETTPPEIYFAAAEKLAAERSRVKFHDAHVNNLEFAGVVAGAAYGKDLRARFTATEDHQRRCLAFLAVRWAPREAIAQLRTLVDSARNDHDKRALLRVMARAYARLGETDAARQALVEAYPIKNMQWTSDDVLLFAALGYLDGALDEMPEHYRARAGLKEVLVALRGSSEERRALRLQALGFGWTQSVEELILLGALAPDQEEAFLDTYFGSHSGFATQMWLRAEAARWRRDEAAAAKWTGRFDRLMARVAKGQNGGLQAVMTPDRLR